MKRNIIWYNPRLKQLAGSLRNNSTRSGIKLWQELKGRQMIGYDFHRQKPLDEFIADFYCHELMLVIELDGRSHDFEEVIARDKIKEKRLLELGINTLRFHDSEVMTDMPNVIRTIGNYILTWEETHPRPLSRGEFDGDEGM